MNPRRIWYVSLNLLKNALAPVLIPLRRERGCLGMDGDPELVLEALDVLSEGFGAAEFELYGRRVLELGPGRTPELTGALILAGARSAVGLDLVVQVPADAGSPRRYAPVAEALMTTRGAHFLSSVGSSSAEVNERYKGLQGDEWPARFMAYPGDRIPLPDRSVDLVVSKSVLEHVAPSGVAPVVAEMYRVLSPDGLAVHWVDLRDHLHIVDDDGVRGDWLDALRYPEPLFRAMFSNRSTAINRLRAPQWREVLETSGFEVEGWWERRFPLAAGFERHRLQPPWRDYDEETLSVGSVCFAARRLAA